MQISPSLLAADFSALAREVSRVASADMLHLDVMDGHFVPNLTFGPGVIASLRDKTGLPFDVHLMLSHPLAYVGAFRKAGADAITFHIECEDAPREVLRAIEETGALPGVALNPETPPEALEPLLQKKIDRIIVMTVHPGFGGQKFMPEVMEKLPVLRQMFPQALLEIDGGVNSETAPLCRGADILVAGTAVFRAADPAAAIRALREM